MTLSRSNRILLAFCCLTFLFAFQPSQAFRLLGTFDEVCYIRWLAYFLGIEHPGCFSDQMQSGIAAVWLPLGAIVRVVGFFIPNLDYLFWLPVTVGISSFLAFAASIFLIHQILKTENVNSVTVTLLFALNIPVLFYATHNTALTHSGELFLALLMIRFLQIHWWGAAIGTAGLLTATRWNDAPSLLLVLGWMARSRQHPFSKRVKMFFMFFGAALAAILLWRAWEIGFVRGYNSSSIPQMLRAVSERNLSRTLFASDWGLVYVNTLWLTVLWLGMVHVVSLPLRSKISLLWLLMVGVLVVLWRGNGRYFGHRYLIGSYAATLLILVDLTHLLSQREKWALKCSAVFGAGWVAVLTLLYPRHWPWPLHDHYSGYRLAFQNGLRAMSPGVLMDWFCGSSLGTTVITCLVKFGWLDVEDGFHGYTLQGEPFIILLALVFLALLILPLAVVPRFSRRGSRTVKPAATARDYSFSNP